MLTAVVAPSLSAIAAEPVGVLTESQIQTQLAKIPLVAPEKYPALRKVLERECDHLVGALETRLREVTKDPTLSVSSEIHIEDSPQVNAYMWGGDRA